jgi:TQXA domain-containing protein/LPXTG-motif cell wall-anchored protein
VRLASVALASGLVAMGLWAGTGTAAADDARPEHAGGAAATLAGLTVHDQAVLHVEGQQDETLSAGLFEMNVDGGGKLKTYGIDIDNATQEGARYLETPWAQSPLSSNTGAGKILWILDHSYPQVDDLARLAKTAHTGRLTPETAAAGTQVAIWRLSDGVDVDASNPAAEKLAAWLGRNARGEREPRTSLGLSPSAVSGRSGDLVGPVTVSTDAGSVTVAPPADVTGSGVTITGVDGKPVKTAKDGTKLYFRVPAKSDSGTARLEVQATTSVPVGRVFSGLNQSQAQILAVSSDATVSASATASWSKLGPVASYTGHKDCAKGGVDITASDSGDTPLTFRLADGRHTVAAGASLTITVPVGEDQKYDIEVQGSDGLEQTFSGILDCTTLSDTPSSDQQITTMNTGTAGFAPGGSHDTVDAAGDLAETGSSSATPVMAGIAIALVVIGGGAVFAFRRKTDATPEG